MKRLFVIFVVLFCLGGCSHASRLVDDEVQLSKVDRVHIVLAGEASESGEVAVVINDSADILEFSQIVSSAKVGSLVRDEDLVLDRPIYYELYAGDVLVKTLAFNGEDTLRVARGGLWYAVSYEGMTLFEWFLSKC